MKKSLILLLFFFTNLIFSQGQKIHRVIITQSIDKENTVTRKYIEIDATGALSVNGKKTGKKINLTSFPAGLQALIKGENIVKTPPDNDRLRSTDSTVEDKKTISIDIVFLEDFKRDKDFIYKSSYKMEKYGLDLEDNNYFFYKYLAKNDVDIIKQLLQ